MFVTSPHWGAEAALSAMVICLRMGVADVGTQGSLHGTGSIWTPALKSDGAHLKAILMSKIEHYAPVLTAAQEIRMILGGFQPGDRKKGVEVMIDRVKGEHCAAGKTVSLRLPIGHESRETIKATCEQTWATTEMERCS